MTDPTPAIRLYAAFLDGQSEDAQSLLESGTNPHLAKKWLDAWGRVAAEHNRIVAEAIKAQIKRDAEIADKIWENTGNSAEYRMGVAKTNRLILLQLESPPNLPPATKEEAPASATAAGESPARTFSHADSATMEPHILARIGAAEKTARIQALKECADIVKKERMRWNETGACAAIHKDITALIEKESQ